MFVPDSYRPGDPSWALHLVRKFPLALLVSPGADDLFATHLAAVPVAESLREGTGDTGLTGTVFVGHMNRNNPHWDALRNSTSALMVFHGPDAYVSPATAGTPVGAPTWNFAKVHLRGTVERLDAAGTMAVLHDTVAAYERDHGAGWDPSGSLAYFDQIAPGAGAFRMTVSSAQAMFKLSQDKPVAVRQRLIDAFDEHPAGRVREVGATMRRFDLGDRARGSA